MSITGNYVDAPTARVWGLVNDVVPHDELLAVLPQARAPTSSRTTRLGVRRMLQTYNEVTATTVDEGWEIEARVSREWEGPGFDPAHRGPPHEDRRARPRPAELNRRHSSTVPCSSTPVRRRGLTRGRLKTPFSPSTMTVSERAAAHGGAPSEAGRRRGRALIEAGAHGAAAQRARPDSRSPTCSPKPGCRRARFYRHFAFEGRRSCSRSTRTTRATAQRRHRERASRPRRIPRAALEMWIDETLASRVRCRGAPRRTQAAARAKAPRLQADFPDEFDDDPGRCGRSADRAARRRSRMPNPELDAWSIYAITWELRRGEAAGRARSHRATAARTCSGSASRRSGFGRSDGACRRPTPSTIDAEIETMPRAELEALQLEALLLEMLPHAYEHSALIRETWDDAGVHPARHPSLDDFREQAPFVDKDAVRRFRDERGDPYGGLLCVPPDELTGVSSTSGTTGDPTLVPEQWGGGGGRPVDHHARPLGLGRAARRLRRARAVHVPRADVRPVPGLARHDADPLRLRPGRDGAVLRAVARVTGRPRSTTSDRCSSTRCRRCATGAASIPHDVFASYKGVTFAGEPLSPRARGLAESLGHRAVRARQRRRRHRLVRMPASTTACTTGRTRCWSKASIPTASTQWPTASGASSSRRRCTTASRR